MDKAPVSVEASDVKKKKPGPDKKKVVESIRCVCSSTVDSGHMVECERCKMWCHSKCVGVAQSTASTLRVQAHAHARIFAWLLRTHISETMIVVTIKQALV